MFWFKLGVIINGIAILLIIANAIYDAIYLNNQFSNSNSGLPNLFGLILIIIIATAFMLKLTGKLVTANIILWIPAAPLLLFLSFSLLYMIVIAFSKKDWR